MDTVRLLGFSEDKIKRAEEALAKYATVDDAVGEISKLSLEDHRLNENPNNDPKQVIDEKELEYYLARGWDLQTVLPSGNKDSSICMHLFEKAHGTFFLGFLFFRL